MTESGSYLCQMGRGCFGPRGRSSSAIRVSRLTVLTPDVNNNHLHTGWGAVKSSQHCFRRTGAPLIRRFFFDGPRFWAFKHNQRNQKPNLFSARWLPGASEWAIYFHRAIEPPGVVKSLEGFDPGPAG